MASMRSTKKVNGYAHKVGISDGSTSSRLVAATVNAVAANLLQPTTATMPPVLQKTWTNAELEVLRSKVGLVAGAIADFQAAGGLVAVKNVEYDPGKFACKVYLSASGINLKVVSTSDGLDFDLVAVEKGNE